MRALVANGEDRSIFDFTTPAELLAKIRKEFCFEETTPVKLQRFDTEFDEWVTISAELVCDKDRLKLFTPVTVLQTAQLSFCAETEAPQATCSVSTMDSTLIDTASDADLRSGTAIMPNERTNISLRPWPVPFMLPSLRTDLKECLAAKEPLTRKLKAALVQACFDEMLKYTIYPTPSQYREVSIRVVTTFPHLVDRLPNCKGYESWCAALSDKFRNERRTMKLDIVQQRKKPKVMVVSGQQNSVWNLPDVERNAGEDDTSIELHKKAMAHEFKKATPDRGKINLLMERTFADRRHLILTGCSIAEVKENFPCLFDQTELLHEFTRLTKTNLQREFEKNLSGLAPKLLRAPLKKTGSFANRCLETAEFESEEEEKTRVLMCGAIWLLPAFFRSDDRQFFIAEQKPTDASPVVVYHPNVGQIWESKPGLFTIESEGQTICMVNNLIQACECLIATYYTFNFAYAKKAMCTLCLIQSGLVRFRDNVPLPRSRIAFVMSLLRNLNEPAR